MQPIVKPEDYIDFCMHDDSVERVSIIFDEIPMAIIGVQTLKWMPVKKTKFYKSSPLLRVEIRIKINAYWEHPLEISDEFIIPYDILHCHVAQKTFFMDFVCGTIKIPFESWEIIEVKPWWMFWRRPRVWNTSNVILFEDLFLLNWKTGGSKYGKKM